MALRRLLSGDPTRSSLLYLAIGGLSLAKAIAVRNDPDRFRRELGDAALFIGVGLVLRRYGTMKARKRAELLDAVPDWAADRVQGIEEGSPTRTRNPFQRSSESSSDRSLTARARQHLAD